MGALEGIIIGAVWKFIVRRPRRLTIARLMLVVAISGPSLAFFVANPPFALLALFNGLLLLPVWILVLGGRPDEVLSETLRAIATKRTGGRFDRSFELADRLVRNFGQHDLAERLYAEISPDCPQEVVADLFGILSWCTSDNGAAIGRTVQRWLLAAEDLRKVRIALHLGVYPFLDHAEMVRVLERIATIHPEVSERCAELIAGRGLLREGA